MRCWWTTPPCPSSAATPPTTAPFDDTEKLLLPGDGQEVERTCRADVEVVPVASGGVDLSLDEAVAEVNAWIKEIELVGTGRGGVCIALTMQVPHSLTAVP